jgi:hypothetical protein
MRKHFERPGKREDLGEASQPWRSSVAATVLDARSRGRPDHFCEGDRSFGAQRAVAIRARGWRLRVELGSCFCVGHASQRATALGIKGQSPLPKTRRTLRVFSKTVSKRLNPGSNAFGPGSLSNRYAGCVTRLFHRIHYLLSAAGYECAKLGRFVRLHLAGYLSRFRL